MPAIRAASVKKSTRMGTCERLSRSGHANHDTRPVQLGYQCRGWQSLRWQSGAIDGNGIPPDFFQDKHVRNAFNWCFDWDVLIDDVLNGRGQTGAGTDHLLK